MITNINYNIINSTQFILIFIILLFNNISCNNKFNYRLNNNINTLTPQLFGAIANDNLRDDKFFNKLFTFLNESPNCYTVIIPAGTYIFNEPVILPDNINCDVLYISGYGAQINLVNSNCGFIQFINRNGTIHNYRPIVKGITLKGRSGNGIKLRGNYTPQIDQCTFIGLDTALISLYSLNGQYQNLRFGSNNFVSFYGSYGDWTGATKSNSAFNCNYIQNCRVYGGIGQITHFEIRAGDNNTINNCISEGYSPRYNILIDSENSPTVNHYINIQNSWIETQSYRNNIGSTFLAFKNLRGIARLIDIQAYPGIQNDTLLQNYNPSPNSTIILDGYRGNQNIINNYINNNYTTYNINNPEKSSQFTNPNNWVNHTLPSKIYFDRNK